MSEAHSPLPWKVNERKDWWTVDSAAGDTVFDDGSAGDEYSPCCTPVDRAFIVRAVNNHDKLVEIVERIAKADTYRGLAVLLESDAVDARALLEEVRGK